jgi:hypothetical protein
MKSYILKLKTMLTRFVCLANSYKEGGRCLAGVELDSQHNPVTVDGRPRWIRPVCKTPHGEIPSQIANPFNVLKVIELETGLPQDCGYQSENIFFNERTLKGVDDFRVNHLDSLCDNREIIFGNKGKAIAQENIRSVNHSLVLIKTKLFTLMDRCYQDTPDTTQQRLLFTYNKIQYDFPITDPVFLRCYKANPKLLDDVNEIYLTCSISVQWANWYYKLIAAIIY